MLAVALAAAVVAVKPPAAQFLRADKAHHVVSVRLVAGYDSSNRGFNFDGYGRGELAVTVPLGWRVRVTCTNRSGVRHSCAVVKGAMATRPAFPRASVPTPLAGLRRGQTASFSFVAARLGAYRLACLVPGHEEARMWDLLDVVRGGAPSIAARPGP
jgi:hypothetical protein